MSCFICSNDHISALAGYAVTHHLFSRDRALVFQSHENQARLQRMGDAELLATLLYEANVRSFSDRYQGRHADDVEPFAFDREASIAARMGNYKPMQIAKAVNCYRYQACDAKDWDDSFADNITSQIRDYAYGEHPDYKAAAWGAPGATVQP